jgi:hypothetical protein
VKASKLATYEINFAAAAAVMTTKTTTTTTIIIIIIIYHSVKCPINKNNGTSFYEVFPIYFMMNLHFHRL